MFKTYDDLKEFIQENEIKMIDFKIVTISGKWNHLSIPASRLSEKVFTDGIGFDGSSYGYAVIESSDMVFIPDLTTAFVDPYCEVPTVSMIANIYEINKKFDRFEGDPRYIAEKAEKFLKESNIADEFIVGPEYEFYVFDHISYNVDSNRQAVDIDCFEAHWNTSAENNQGYKVRFQGGYHAGLPYDSTNDLRSDMCLRLEEMGVPVKYHHHEVGSAAQVEIEVELGEMLKMADATLLAKYVIKNTAMLHGKTATFMPKPIYGEAGSGMHVHMLLKKDGHNIFFDENGYSGLSKEAMFFIGGVLKHAPSLLAFTNPSTNSYKRLVPGFEAPVSICFATSNRSSVIRIPGYAKNPEKKRFEFRSSDGTCNPYLAFSALLMAGIDGIINKIDPVKEEYGPYDVNIYDLSEEEKKKIKGLPKSLDEALDALKGDYGYLLRGGVFTKQFIDSWINYKYNKELVKINPVPTPMEFQMYYDV
ncbi:Glutamine synthetase [Caloramator mitchellensis]|uniref:Glutamine synthetase n=1 Tax=Caloramator mitchellensis TaxID=908809 RepID=A0A0R3JUU6_CALMK|nr:type I glutamate--ammonia ligase [Caloramator mitchellensis]KRQ87355.1 Glutamine synthetase [Caloramator mitchellensis]